MEIWLLPNRRFFILQLALQSIAAGVCLAVALAVGWLSGAWIVAGLIALLAVVLAVFSIRSLRHWSTPRIARLGSQVQISLAPGSTYRIPLELVECFFLGQGAAGVPVAESAGAASSTVVVRLAERATEWHRRPVAARWGHWCDGYITLRGTWCEPIDLSRINQLNHSLAAAKRQTAGSRAPVSVSATGSGR